MINPFIYHWLSLKKILVGVYTPNPGAVLLGFLHIKIVGWGHDLQAGDYWICANSWNADWGEQGKVTSAKVTSLMNDYFPVTNHTF